MEGILRTGGANSPEGLVAQGMIALEREVEKLQHEVRELRDAPGGS